MTSKQRFVLAVLAGAGAALGHAPFGLWPVSLLSFAAILWLVSKAERPGLIGWAGGIGYFATALHWIVQPFLVDVARHGWMAPFALVFLAAGLALFWGLAGRLSARLVGYQPLSFAMTLSLAELVRGYVLTGFPWALPAYIWTDTSVRMTAAFWGPYGLTVLTLALLALPFVPRTRSRQGAALVVTCIGFLGLIGLGKTRPEAAVPPDAPVVRLVQPNAPQDEKWDPQKAHVFVNRQIEYTAADEASDPKLIVWPESAVPYRLDSSLPILARITEAAEGAEVVLGINRTENDRHHNSLITLPGNAIAPAEVYDKVHLVPFGEFIPFGQAAEFFGLQSFAARDGYGFSPGDSVRLINTGIGRALPLICYEAIFPQHLRRAGERPDYLLQITNDAWFGAFSGPYQHLDQARFRAAEHGLPLIRVANTGVSAMINARGEVEASLALGEAGYLDARLPAAFPPTPYSRWGDLPVAVFLLSVVCGLFFVNKRNTIA